MIPRWSICIVASVVVLGLRADGRVVINEIFYHAPDEIKQLEYIELHNSGDEAVDLSGWGFTKGVRFKFDPGMEIPAKGFLVLCRNKKRFSEFYNTPVAAEFKSKLSNKGERLELSDARGRIVDIVKYQDSAPWPLGADGLSGSLERICPEAAGDNPANWACSPLSTGHLKPAGTPGKTNANYCAHLPP
ncbi:MAG TPA: lamin tail domain-containing protein, partial [Candidatus Binatia bacterium]|nr:lamin tail domain-containing protein [Candidatus Binatia bacterium]